MKNYVFIKKLIGNHSELEIFDVGHITYSKKNVLTVFFIRINKELSIQENIIENFDIENTGDSFEYKVCDRCFKYLKTSANFSGNRIKKHGIITNRPSCKACRKIKDGKNISNRDRNIWDKNKPVNFSLFTCPICKKTTIVGLSKIVLDHCHKTGKVRGYLCESCNTGIGRFDDDPNLVSEAKKWLERPV